MHCLKAFGAGALLFLFLVGCGGGGGESGKAPFSPGGIAGVPVVPPTPITSGGGISVVSTGVPSQRFMSISAGTYNLNWGFDGITTAIQIYVADTAGNPVPDGSVIQFSAEGGQIETSCRTTGVANGTATISGCSVTFNTQDYRPLDGTVTIIAWMQGEEAYRDVNGNGKYEFDEPFIDNGRIFRDDDNSLTLSTKDELLIDTSLTGSPGLGGAACESAPLEVNVNEIPISATGTCDGIWGRSLIRRTILLPVSDPRIMRIVAVLEGVKVGSGPTGFHTVETAAPSGTTVTVLNPPAACTVVVSPSTVGSAEVEPTIHKIVGTDATGQAGACSGKTVLVEAKFGTYSPVSTSFTFP